MTDGSPSPGFGEDTGVPRWVKVFVVLFLLLVLLVVVALLAGGHGPGVHTP